MEKNKKRVLTKTQTCMNRGFANFVKNTIYSIKGKYLALYLVDMESWVCYNEKDSIAAE